MTDEIKQPVVDDTKVAAEPAAAVDSARKDDAGDIDSLLAQFDQETAKPVPPPDTKTDMPQWAVELQNYQKQQQVQQSDKEIREIASRVFDGLDVPPRSAKGWLEEYARENPKVSEAYMKLRHDSPEWRRIERALSVIAKKEHGEKIDIVATADHDAVAAAVRGASTKIAAEPAPNLSRMSDAELRKYTMDNFGF